MNETKKRLQDKITIEEIIQLKESGLTYREIGTMFGVTKQMIHGVIKKHQSSDNPVVLNDKTVCLLQNDFDKSGCSLTKYAAKLNLSPYIVKTILSHNAKKVKKETVSQIANILNVSESELIKVNNTNNPKFLPSNLENSHDVYKEFVYNNIINGSGCVYRGKAINGAVEISRDAANLIKAYRINNNLSVTEFAEMAGVSISVISRIENYKASKIKYSSLKTIAKALGVTVEQLLVDNESIGLDVDSADYKIRIDTTTAHNIRYRRIALKLTQAELGNICGVKQPFISSIEVGILKTVKKSILKTICRTLDLNYTEIINAEYA